MLSHYRLLAESQKIFSTYFIPLIPLASVSAQIPQKTDNFRFLSAVAQDHLGFLALAADLDQRERKVVQNLIYFGPARYLKSTSKSGLLRGAFAKYGIKVP